MIIAVDLIASLSKEIKAFQKEIENICGICHEWDIEVKDIDDFGYHLNYEINAAEWDKFIEYTDEGDFIAHEIEKKR